MNPLELIYAIATLALFYVLFARMKAYEARLTQLENQRKEPEKRVQTPAQVVQPIYPPIENFTPKKPETLRPNQVRGREVDQNVYEFDAKI